MEYLYGVPQDVDNPRSLEVFKKRLDHLGTERLQGCTDMSHARINLAGSRDYVICVKHDFVFLTNTLSEQLNDKDKTN